MVVWLRVKPFRVPLATNQQPELPLARRQERELESVTQSMSQLILRVPDATLSELLDHNATVSDQSGFGSRNSGVNLTQTVRLERSLDAGERVRRGIRGIFLTLSVRTTILDKGFSCRVRAFAQFLL